MKETGLAANEYPIPEGEPNVLSEGAWTHIRCVTKQTARKFNLNEEDQDELYSRLKCAAYAAAIRTYDKDKAKDGAFVAGVVRHVLLDWRKEQFGKTSDREEWRIRRILYSPSRHGTVAKMIRKIDFNFAKGLLDADELELLELYVNGNAAIKTVGKSLGYSDRRTLDMWAGIKGKFSDYYGRKLKRD